MPVQGKGGQVSSVIGFSLDVSPAKHAEQEIRAKLDLIGKQQQVIRDLSTPIIEVWEGVLTLPMVGVVDSMRTSEVMQSLLSRIVETGARYAILDLTGVEVVDTRVAGHLISLVSAIRLLGAEGIITGIKPNVAQTIVALGLDLSSMTTHANLRAGLKFCIQRMAKDARPA
jgi:rsbT co-antagonist protein RsbR